MTRMEFIQQLREALGNDLSSNVVQENVSFYDQYITDEVSKGKSEAEVLSMLGDPWILARTIVDAQDGTDQSIAHGTGNSNTGYNGETSKQGERQTQIRTFGLDTWWKKLLLILAVIMVVVVIFSIVTGLVRLVAPIVVPIVVIMLIVRVFSNRRS